MIGDRKEIYIVYSRLAFDKEWKSSMFSKSYIAAIDFIEENKKTYKDRAWMVKQEITEIVYEYPPQTKATATELMVDWCEKRLPSFFNEDERIMVNGFISEQKER